MATRAFSYGILSPGSVNDRIFDQELHGAHRYFNALIEIAREQRMAFRNLRAVHFPEVVEMEKELGRLMNEKRELEKAIDAKKAATRSRKVDPTLKLSLRGIEKDIGVLEEKLTRPRAWINHVASHARLFEVQAIQERKKVVRPPKISKKKKGKPKVQLFSPLPVDLTRAASLALIDRIVADPTFPFMFLLGVVGINRAGDTRGKQAYAEARCLWGTRLATSEAAEQAIKEAKKQEPQFRTWMGEGRLAIQFQGGATVEKLNKNKHMRLIWPDMPEGTPRSEIKKRRMVKFRWHTHTDEWAEATCLIHRPIPDDAKIQWVYLTRRRRSVIHPWRYAMQVVFRSEKVLRAIPHETQKGITTINFGWRQFPATHTVWHKAVPTLGGKREWIGRELQGFTLRVAQLNNTVSGLEEIRLPPMIVARFQKCSDLRSIQDKHFDATQAALAAWLALDPTLPERFPSYITKIKSKTRLANIVWAWKRDRFAGDEAIFPILDAWRVKWRHLQGWEDHNRERALYARRAFYQELAHRITTTSATIAFEDFDLRKVAKNAPPATEATGGLRARRNRGWACISEFRAILESTAQRQHCEVQLLPAWNNTMCCNVCHELITEDPAAHVNCTCPNEHCWDQDVNNTDNQHERLERGEGRVLFAPA